MTVKQKPMNEVYAERYDQLVRVMQGLPTHVKLRHFIMEAWVRKTECGTTMCAAGFAGADPWFRRRKFTIDRNQRCPVTREGGIYLDGWNAVEAFFGRLSGDGWEMQHPVFGTPRTVGRVVVAAKLQAKRWRNAKLGDRGDWSDNNVTQ